MAGQFEKFTGRAKQVLTLAHEEAQRFEYNFIGTEHLLLGLVREKEGVAGRVLHDQGLELNRVRALVGQITGQGERATRGELQLNEQAIKLIGLAVEEAQDLGHDFIGTEHLLLGLLRQEEGIVSKVLEELGVEPERIREQVLKIVSGLNLARTPINPATLLRRKGQNWLAFSKRRSK
jgi:ATP-dependent Clp protease ATP-binding subunit ClpC